MAFPATLDTYTAQVDNIDKAQAADINAAYTTLTALQTKIGVDNSAVNTTLDWLIKNTNSLGGGHKHNGTTLINITEASIDRASPTPLLARLAENESVTGAWKFISAGVQFQSGYGLLPAAAKQVAIGANGVDAEKAASICFGDLDGVQELAVGVRSSGSFLPMLAFRGDGSLIAKQAGRGFLGRDAGFGFLVGDGGATPNELLGTTQFQSGHGAVIGISMSPNSTIGLSKMAVGVPTSSSIVQFQLRGPGESTAAIPLDPADGATLFLEDNSASVLGRGGTLLIGSGGNGRFFAAIKGLVGTYNDNTHGSLAIALRKIATDATLTEIGRFTIAGNFCLGATDITRTGTVGAFSARGVSTQGVFEMSTGGSDAADALLGSVHWSDRHLAIADKLSSAINVTTEGTTATARGSKMNFFTKRDNGALSLRMALDRRGVIFLSSATDLAGLGDPVGGAFMFCDSADGKVKIKDFAGVVHNLW